MKTINNNTKQLKSKSRAYTAFIRYWLTNDRREIGISPKTLVLCKNSFQKLINLLD